jgi:hypothetical protein
LIDRRRHSNILEVRSFRAADCDTDHYFVVTKVRERLAVSKQSTRRVHMERFNLKKLSKERYRVEISNRSAALENLDTEGDVNKAWENIRQNIKISAKESLGYYEPKNKSWFDERCSKLSDPQAQGSPITPPGTSFPFHCLPKLAQLWRRHSNLPPHGEINRDRSQIYYLVIFQSGYTHNMRIMCHDVGIYMGQLSY